MARNGRGGGGIKAAVKAVLVICYDTWLRMDKVASSPALQVLASRGQLRTVDINRLKKEESNITVEALEQRLNPLPAQDLQ